MAETRALEIVFDDTGRCSICGTKRGGCDCWTKCDQPGCLWFYRKGLQCANATHALARGQEQERK